MKTNHTERALAIQVPLTVSPVEGRLVASSRLKRFQQEGFSWEMRITAHHRSGSGALTVVEIPPEQMQDKPQSEGHQQSHQDHP